MAATPGEHLEDKDLLQHYYQDGDNEWLGILLERYTLLLFGVSMKYLKDEEAAKDSVQQIFLKVIHELKKHKVEYFKSWLYMVAKNHCLMQLRNKNRYAAPLTENVMASYPNDAQGQTPQEKDLDLEKLSMAVAQLNEEQKVCITLFYLQKKSYQDIVHVTGFEMMKVKSHIQNGKRNLKILMEKMRHE
ncbi:MAG: sigma-70 family RNA polymerase sigma factor [Ferruginibacter sp.]